MLEAYGRRDRLTDTEQRLLPAIGVGARIKEMATKMRLSPCMVRVPLKNIRQKTGRFVAHRWCYNF